MYFLLPFALLCGAVDAHGCILRQSEDPIARPTGALLSNDGSHGIATGFWGSPRIRGVLRKCVPAAAGGSKTSDGLQFELDRFA